VAATDVLGVGLVLRGFETVALSMWLIALSAWLGLVYFGFGVLILVNHADRADIVRGGWLMAIVATESLVIPGLHVAPLFADPGAAAPIFLEMLWGLGVALYAVFVTLFAWRVFFLQVGPDELSPALWVVMGAAAIGVNAGASLSLAARGMSFLDSLKPVIDASILVMWAWATLWIPLLLLLGVWKHGIRGRPLAYTPLLWSAVFPLGMYGVASMRLAAVAGLAPLLWLAHAFAWIGLAAWAAMTTSLIVASRRSCRAFLEPPAATE
jgi:tellurite resistance protein TehA-like permease